MEWQQIIGFYQVARLESFTRAASATFRTQSALSQQIKALEEELDCELIERIGRRKLQLTPAGERFLKFASTLLDQHDQLIGELNELKGHQIGRLRIAAQFAPLYYLLPKMIEKYIHDFPQVELTILERPPMGVIDLVKSGDIDFGIAIEAVIPKDLATIRLKNAESVLVAPVDHPLTKVKRITLRHIAQYPLILGPKNLKHTYREKLERRFEALGITYRIIMESPNIVLSARYVEAGLGISVVAMGFGLKRLKRRKLAFIPLDNLFNPDHVAIVMRKDKVLPPYKSAFLNILFGETMAPGSSSQIP
jgi:DNA-binding transcriptional LysR family regulator